MVAFSSKPVIIEGYQRESLGLLRWVGRDGLHIIQDILHKRSQDHACDGIRHLNAWDPSCGGRGHMPCIAVMKDRCTYVTVIQDTCLCGGYSASKGKRVGGLLWTGPRMTLGHLFNHIYPFFPVRQELVLRPETTCTTSCRYLCPKVWKHLLAFSECLRGHKAKCSALWGS